MTDLALGATLNDRYNLEAELGRGGMGAVYRGFDPQLERGVAIKVLSTLTLGTDGRLRLMQEARAIARLNHPNIVAVHDVGEVDKIPYIVMELVEGRDLHHSPPSELPHIVEIARQVCDALQHAHDQGVIHRDLKPENVLVGHDGAVKLVDFGIARSMASRLTTEGQITGTVYYLAPELALGQEADGRADLYSLGVMLYELVTGGLPFVASDPLAVISQHLHATVVPPSAKNEAVTPRLENLILQLLSKRAEDRPATAQAVAELLDLPDLLDPLAETDRGLAVIARIARGRFVGRQRELQQARSIWARAATGEGQALLISGEPGIGKSRFVSELATQVEVTGGRVLIGESYAEGGAPLSPIAQMLRKAIGWTTENGSNLPGFVLADLLSLTPELRPQFPDLPANPALDPESEQRRLFESVVALFSHLAERSPLLVILEDAHWSDSGTLALVQYLVRRTRSMPVLLVTTYREVELDEALPLNNLLVELNRERLATRLKLARLDRDQTRALLAAIFEEEITPEFLEGIYLETDGNPFFIEELCKALVENGTLHFENGRWHRPDDMRELALPQSVRIAVQARLSKLAEPVHEVLRTAAVLGREFDFDTLIVATESGEDELIDALEAAERSQLIEELGPERGGTFRFAHALIASTLVESLSGLRRRRTHKQAAAAIDKLRPDDLEALAHHYYESGDLDHSLGYSMRAGERAHQLFSLTEARKHFRRALEIAESHGPEDQLPAILQVLGDVEGGANLNLSQEYFERALKLTSNPTDQAVLKGKLGRVYAVTGDERALPLLQAAQAALERKTYGNELAQAIASVGRIYHNRGQHRKAKEQLERALEIAEPLQHPNTLFLVYTFLAGTHQHMAEFERSNDWARRELQFGEQTNHSLMRALGHEYLAENHNFMGKWEQALEHARQDEQIGLKTGLHERTRWGRFSSFWALYNLGELEQAIELGRHVFDEATRDGDPRLAVLASAQLASAYADVNDFKAATDFAGQSAERAAELDQAYMVGGAQDSICYVSRLKEDRSGALEAARVIMDAAAGTDNRIIQLVSFPGAAEALLDDGQEDVASSLIAQALETADGSDSPAPTARLLRVRGRLRMRQGDAEAAQEDFARAVALCEQWKSWLVLGRTLLDWAALKSEQDDVQEGQAMVRRALEMFEEAGAKYWIERADSALSALNSTS